MILQSNLHVGQIFCHTPIHYIIYHKIEVRNMKSKINFVALKLHFHCNSWKSRSAVPISDNSSSRTIQAYEETEVLINMEAVYQRFVVVHYRWGTTWTWSSSNNVVVPNYRASCWDTKQSISTYSSNLNIQNFINLLGSQCLYVVRTPSFCNCVDIVALNV